MAQFQARGSQLNFTAGSGIAQGQARVTGLKEGGFAVSWIGSDSDRTAFDGDLFGIQFDPQLAPLTADPRMLITDTGPSGSYPVNQAITGLKNGGYAIVSTDDANYTVGDAASHRDVAVRVYDANGAQIGSPVYLGSSSILGVTATTLNDGRLVTGWVDVDGAARAQYLDQTGAVIGSSFVVADPGPDFASRPVFSALSNGGWVATYVAQNGATGHAIFYDKLGNPSADATVAMSVTNILGVQAQGLANGGAVLAWTQLTPSQTVETRAQIYSAAGGKIGSELLLSNAASSVISVAQLVDGGFAVGYEVNNQTQVQVKTYDATGHQTGSTTTINGAFEPSVSATSDGGYVVVWKDAAAQQFHAQAYGLVVESAPPIIGNAGDDSLSGDWRADTLIGLGGNDFLTGGAGSPNTMQGGTGNDYYFVSVQGDSVVEFANEGRDQVRTDLSRFVLPANVEQLVYTGLGSFNGVGNDLDNLIVGSAYGNILDGGLGSDTLVGGAGNDIMIGGAGATNTLQGGAGDDLYFVSVRGDSIVESNNGGRDQVRTSLDAYFLSENVETLTYMGQGSFIGTGNGVGNLIAGGSGNDILNGMGGSDILLGGDGDDILIGGDGPNTMQGGAGNDIYFVTAAGDTVFEEANQGRDQVRTDLASYTLSANVEYLVYTGQSSFIGVGNELDNLIQGGGGSDTLSAGGGNDILIGGGGNDTLTGGAGADQLNGGLGADTLIGGADADTFLFDSELSASNIDRITDFDTAADRILLDRAIFSTVGAGQLLASAFAIGSAATDASQRIIYNSTSGSLFYDSDGNGSSAQVQFATLGAGLQLTAASFSGIGTPPGTAGGASFQIQPVDDSSSPPAAHLMQDLQQFGDHTFLIA